MTSLRVCAATLLLVTLLPPVRPAAAGAGGLQTAGDLLTAALPAAAAALTLGLKDGDGAWQLGESLAVTLVVTFGLKYTVREERPDDDRRDSFPSGHASLSFSAAEYLRKRYGWQYGVPAYAVAAFAAVSRVESRQHRAQDVLAGAAIGAASSYFLTDAFDGWTVGGAVGGGFRGVTLSRGW